MIAMKKLKQQWKKYFPLCLKDWLVFFVTMGLTSVVCQTLKGVSSSDVHVPMIFVLAVLIVALLTNGYFYGTLAALISVVVVNWLMNLEIVPLLLLEVLQEVLQEQRLVLQ